MDIDTFTRKDIGELGERIAEEYLRRRGFQIVARNYTCKSGELDRVTTMKGCLHVVEVKALVCNVFPRGGEVIARYDPVWNLHPRKISKVKKAAEWYIAHVGWEGQWQIDGALVWIRRRDGMGFVRYLPAIVS